MNAQFFNIGFHPTPAPHHLLQSAPHLHSAELHNPILNPFPRYWIPWSQWTHLHGEHQLGEQVWYILICHCANLQHRIFSLNMPGTIHPPSIPTSSHDIILPFLVDLTIHTFEQGQQPNFCQLVFPTLQRLQLLFYHKSWDGPAYLWDSPHLRGTHLVSLTSLVLVGSTFFGEGQAQFLLGSLPSLTKLCVLVVKNYSTFFITLSNVQLVPKLKSLPCDIQAFWNAETTLPQLIASFVRSRWLISPPIAFRHCCHGSMMDQNFSWPLVGLGDHDFATIDHLLCVKVTKTKSCCSFGQF